MVTVTVSGRGQGCSPSVTSKLFGAMVGVLVVGIIAARAQTIALPEVPAAVFNITNFGAVGDGHTPATAAIQKTVDAASAAGGGMVLVPAGKYLTGPFTLASRIHLHLAEGAVLLLSDDRTNYPVSRGRYVDAITAPGAHDVQISGPGTIDGQGRSWWEEFRANPAMTHRPYLIRFSGCERVEVSDVTLQNSPMFHLVPQDCTDVTIRHVTIRAPANSPNTDGIDPSGWNYFITGCFIDTGDDNIAIKPGKNRSPGDKNYLVTDCTFLHGHGMSVGGGTTGGLYGLTVSNCTFDATDSGIRIKTHRGAGGLLENAVYENLTMNAVKNPIYIIDWYPERTAPENPATEAALPVNSLTPLNRHIVIKNLTAGNCSTAGTIRGLPEAPISDVLLSNVNLSATFGLKIYHATNIQFVDSSVTSVVGKNIDAVDAHITGLAVPK